MPYILLTIALVALDQLVKYLVTAYIPLYGSVPFLPGILDFTHVENTGAAFSILSEYTWLLTLSSLVMSAVLALAVWKKFFRHPLGRTALTLILAGALGNLIDRALRGYVVDMFRPLFINFAVFNVADICVVAGGFAVALYYVFLYDKLEGKPPKEQRDDPPEQDG